MSDREYHRVAVVVFVEAKGIDGRDAANCAVMAMEQNLRPGTTVPVVHMAGHEEVRICDHVSVGDAVGGRYLKTSPTGEAYRGRFSWSPPEEES